jgi:hypothetical protein
VEAALERINERKEQLVGGGTLDEDIFDDEILKEAIANYDVLLSQSERELASSINLANIIRGNIGLVLTRADGYGGKTIAGEIRRVYRY